MIILVIIMLIPVVSNKLNYSGFILFLILLGAP